MTDNLPPPGHVRALTWEEMSEAQREACGPRRRTRLPQCETNSMKRRGVPSPDVADALACTFGGEIATLPQLSEWVQPGQVVSEWNPFSNEAIRGDPLPESRVTHGRYYAPPEEGWEYPRLRPEYE